MFEAAPQDLWPWDQEYEPSTSTYTDPLVPSIDHGSDNLYHLYSPKPPTDHSPSSSQQPPPVVHHLLPSNVSASSPPSSTRCYPGGGYYPSPSAASYSDSQQYPPTASSTPLPEDQSPPSWGGESSPGGPLTSELFYPLSSFPTPDSFSSPPDWGADPPVDLSGGKTGGATSSPLDKPDDRSAAKRSKQAKAVPDNSKSVSCCRGVYFDQIRHLWRANWPEESVIIDKATQRMIDIRRCTRTKGFSAKKYGYQEAQRLAIEHREKMTGPGMVRHFVYRDDSSPETPPAIPGSRSAKKRNNNTNNHPNGTTTVTTAEDQPPTCWETESRPADHQTTEIPSWPTNSWTDYASGPPGTDLLDFETAAQTPSAATAQ